MVRLRAQGRGQEAQLSTTALTFVCRDCRHHTATWVEQCPTCGGLHTLVSAPHTGVLGRDVREQLRPVPLPEIDTGGGLVRLDSGIGELDRPLGGGLVPGSVVLVGGDPGVGKSTLVLTACHAFAQGDRRVLYATGEESLRQVKLRAERVGIDNAGVHLLATTDWEHLEVMAGEVGARVLVVDSVQTVAVPSLAEVPGSVNQVREVAHRARLLATRTGVAVLLVGHSSRSSELAGPRVLEHFVDAVLDFEGDGPSGLRTLRTFKNRYGRAGELGLFEMVAEGLREVRDASERLLTTRKPGIDGTAVVATMEGTRALLTEVQALVGRPTAEDPPRFFVGVEPVRVLMLAAVVENAGLPIYNRGLYVNTVSGYRLDEPGGDLGVIAALASSHLKWPVRADTLVFGEVGLVGQVKPVRDPGPRLAEAQRMGFQRVIAPIGSAKDAPEGLVVAEVDNIRHVLAELFDNY